MSVLDLQCKFLWPKLCFLPQERRAEWISFGGSELPSLSQVLGRLGMLCVLSCCVILSCCTQGTGRAGCGPGQCKGVSPGGSSLARRGGRVCPSLAVGTPGTVQARRLTGVQSSAGQATCVWDWNVLRKGFAVWGFIAESSAGHSETSYSREGKGAGRWSWHLLGHTFTYLEVVLKLTCMLMLSLWSSDLFQNWKPEWGSILGTQEHDRDRVLGFFWFFSFCFCLV